MYFKSVHPLFLDHQSHPGIQMKMSQSYYESRFEHNSEKYCAMWSIQIFQWLLFISAIWSAKFAHGLESRDAIFLNFHQKYNVPKVAALRSHAYLPSIVPDFSLPEVIDNRVRTLGANYAGNGIQVLQHYRRPYSPQGKHSRAQSTTQLPSLVETSDSLANHISIEEMSCQNTGDKLFFRVSIKAPKISNSPVVDNIVSDNCRAIAIKDTYRINFEKDQFWNCGIVDCSTEGNHSYCLDLRFPAITGLRLKDDYKITLRCKAQEKIAHQTKRINVKTLETKARSIPNVINGGVKNALDVDVGLFRKTYGSENIFDARIESGSTVILGEEILLRVLVNGDDGWRHSRIGQVTVHYVEKKQQQNVVNSLWILDKDGCLNSDVREICPREQYMSSPLETYLIFQAFMFEGMKETDEMFLTVKATACLEAVDCVLDCPAGHVRRTRSIRERNNTVEWQDDIALRVVFPNYELRVSQNYYLPILSSVIVLFVFIGLFWSIKILFRRRIAKF